MSDNPFEAPKEWEPTVNVFKDKLIIFSAGLLALATNLFGFYSESERVTIWLYGGVATIGLTLAGLSLQNRPTLSISPISKKNKGKIKEWWLVWSMIFIGHLFLFSLCLISLIRTMI